MSIAKFVKPFLFSTLLFFAVGCTTGIDDLSEDAFTVTNSEEELSVRLELLDSEIEVRSDDEQGKQVTAQNNHNFSLSLVASVEPPSLDGVTLQATMIDLFSAGNRAAVSYNVRGQIRRGGIDILQLPAGNSRNLRIRSGVAFNDANVNAVNVNEDRIWSAQSSDNPSLVNEGEYSATRQFSLSGFNISVESIRSASLPGFAANSIKEFGDRIYITSGDNAGLSVYNLDLTTLEEFVEIDDARWVDVNNDWVVVLSGGTGGTIQKFNRSTMQLEGSFSFPGANTPEAKNTVEIIGELALIAAGQSGAHIMDLNNGTILHTIPLPNAANLGLDPDRVETNAVSADQEFIFISNGEAGVYVAEASTNLNNYTSGNQLSVTLLGSLQFGDSESVNHVTYRDNNLFIASGLGGVKAVRLSR